MEDDLSGSEGGRSTPESNMKEKSAEFDRLLKSLLDIESLDATLSAAGEMADLNIAIDRAISLINAPDSKVRLAIRFSLVSQLLEMRFDRDEDPEDIKAAIKYAEAALKSTNHGHPDRADMLHNLGSLLGTRYGSSGSLQDLDDAINNVLQAQEVALQDNPKRASMLQDLGYMLSDRYERQGDLADIENAIQYTNQAIQTSPLHDDDRADKLCNLANYLSQKHQRLKNIEDLQAAIRYAEEAASTPSLDPLDRAKKCSNLGGFLYMRYKCLGETEDLEQAIKHADDALKMIPVADQDRESIMSNFESFLESKFEKSEELPDLERLINLRGELIKQYPASSDIDIANRLDSLAACHWFRFKLLQELSDLKEAIKNTTEALEYTPPDDLARTERLQRLVRFMWQSCLSEQPSDLDNMINRSKEVLESMRHDDEGRAEFMIIQGSFLWMQHRSTGEMDYMNKAITMIGGGLTLRYHDDSSLALGPSTYLLERYKGLGDDQNLGKAICWAQDALKSSKTNSSAQATVVKHLLRLLKLRYFQKGQLEDLQTGLDLGQEACALVPGNDPFPANMLVGGGIFAYVKCRLLRDFKGLKVGVKSQGRGLTVSVVTDCDRPGVLGNHAYFLASRYERFRDVKDLEQAIRLGQEGLEGISEQGLRAIPHLVSLSGWYMRRYHRFRSHNDLEQAISLAEKALGQAPDSFPKLGLLKLNLSDHLTSQYIRSGSLNDLQRALELVEESLALSPGDNFDLANKLVTKAHLLWYRYDRLGDDNDLEEAVRGARRAVQYSSSDDPQNRDYLCTLGYLLCARCERFGDLDDLKNAVQKGREAVAGITFDNGRHVHMLQCLGRSLWIRYERLGDLEDLEQAIQLSENALKAIPDDHPDHSQALANLSSVLQSRYERFGDVTDLEKAIKWTTDVSPNQLDRADRLSTIGSRLWNRYRRFESLEDLEKAIKWTEAAMILTPNGHTSRPGILMQLANHLASRYERCKVLVDINQAIELADEAFAALPQDHVDHAILLSNSSTYLVTRFDQFGDIADLELAIARTKQAMSATPANQPHRASMLINLATWFRKKYDRLGEICDLQDALSNAQLAAAATPPDHASRAYVLNIVAAIALLHSPSDTQYSIEQYRDAWNCTGSRPAARIEAAHGAAGLLARERKWQESYSLLDGAVQLLPRVSPHWLGRDDQQYTLSKFSQLTAEALSVALENGVSPSKCMTLLELGRGIIMGLTIDCRSDISDLAEQHPELHDKFDRLRKYIDSPHQNDQRRDAMDEMGTTLTFIRQLPGFKYFQLPPVPEDLMAMTIDGPIVVVNSTQFRSDALLVTNSSITSLPLFKLSFEDIKRRIPQIPNLTRGKRSTYPSRNEELAKILLWLWDTVVEPVFSALRIDADAENNAILPHVTWIGVGLPAVAPFHAAGDHSPTSRRNTTSMAISSYIPTIKALRYARQKKFDLAGRIDSRVLLISMPVTPGKRPLPKAAHEVRDIIDIIQGRSITTELISPSSADVLAQLPQFNAIHFACHAVSDSRNPSDSHLLLLNNTGPLATRGVDKLSVRMISNTNTRHAQLAYLSACCAADNPSEPLADEWIHLASAFQLAGFSHVLATLWASNDGVNWEVATAFYNHLFSSSATGGHRAVRSAFHQATQKLKDKYREQPILWASFIHTGA